MKAKVDDMSNDNELTSMTVSLPVSQKEYVKTRAVHSGCSTPSEYIRRLIHADQKATTDEDLERKILEALSSNVREIGPDEWKSLRRSLKASLIKKRKPK